MLNFFQEKLIFLPSVLDSEYAYQFSSPFEEFTISASDGAALNALHFKHDNPKGVILYFHGNAGDLSRWGNMAIPLVNRGYAVIIMDYRTYGKSTGKLSEQALHDDAELFYAYAEEYYGILPILLYGRSLGTGIATQLAAKKAPEQLILETPYYSLVDVAKDRFPFLPVQWLLKYKMESFRYISKVRCPITIFHGTSDGVVPYESGEKLYEEIAGADKQFFTIKEGEHNNLAQFDTYQNGLSQVLGESNKSEDR